MRYTLASVLLRLLGSRVVHEDAMVNAVHYSSSRREVESPAEAAFVDSSVQGLFDRLLLILHGLLSSSPPIWLRLKPVSKTIDEPTKEFSEFEREQLEALQVCMILQPLHVRPLVFVSDHMLLYVLFLILSSG